MKRLKYWDKPKLVINLYFSTTLYLNQELLLKSQFNFKEAKVRGSLFSATSQYRV